MSPNQPRPGWGVRSIRVSLDLWHAAQAKAHGQGETVSDVIRRALKQYIERGKS